jgi:DnaJ-domain-containing protein 1
MIALARAGAAPRRSVKRRLVPPAASGRSQPPVDPFQALGVPRSASAAEVRESYVALIRGQHPDVNAAADATQAAARLNAAYEEALKGARPAHRAA